MSLKTISYIALFVVISNLMACSKSSSSSSNSTTASEDSSASGVAASAVGGAIANSSSNGTVSLLEKRGLYPRSPLLSPFTSETANAANTSCPTLKSSNSSGANTCSSTSNVATLDYSSCSFGSSAATWTGYMNIQFSGSTTLSCGTFPSPTSDTMIRQWVNSGATQPSTGSRTSAQGNVVTMDDTTSGIDSNYQSDTFNGSGASGLTISTVGVGAKGGAKQVTFNSSGKRTGVTVLEHVSAVENSTTVFDHTVAGSVTLSESGSGSSSSWSVSTGTVSSGQCTSGGMIVYHNLVKVMGRTCFQSVTYDTSCCTPVSGTVTTTFSTTSASSGAISALMNGKTESLTFNGCGSATYTNYAGASSTVSMGHCF